MKKKKTNNNSSGLVTKSYLDKTLDARFDTFETRTYLKFDDFERKINDLITKTLDKLYTRIDPLLSEIVNSRIDREMSTEAIEDLRSKTKDHEKRITKIEKN